MEHDFLRSPFSLTASPETAACWAGRPSVLERLKRLENSFTRRSDSSLDMMWANLGAGKSHVLYHFAYRLTNSEQSANLLPVVIEMPEQIRKFHDLYRRIMTSIPERPIIEAAAGISGSAELKALKQAAQVL